MNISSSLKLNRWIFRYISLMFKTRNNESSFAHVLKYIEKLHLLITMTWSTINLDINFWNLTIHAIEIAHQKIIQIFCIIQNNLFVYWYKKIMTNTIELNQLTTIKINFFWNVFDELSKLMRYFKMLKKNIHFRFLKITN